MKRVLLGLLLALVVLLLVYRARENDTEGPYTKSANY